MGLLGGLSPERTTIDVRAVSVLGPQMSKLGVAVLVLALALATALAGCGGDDEGSGDDWAAGVCAEVNGWADELDATLESLGEEGLELDQDDLRAAGDRVSEATDELEAGLDELGPPETESSQAAEQELEQLRAELRKQLDVIEAALEGEDEPLQAVATVASAAATAANQLQLSLDTLEGLDPGGELSEDFENSDECQALRERVENTGS
jgi:hypothetical protein